MYIQLTTRCNMTCAHCCMGATAKGQDMSLRTYKAALRWARQLGEFVALGGGEPTLHPRFWEFLGLALGEGLEGLWLATNGKITTTALALAGLARKGALGVALSQDEWHDPIDKRVVQAFTRQRRTPYEEPRSEDMREIRTVTRIINQGRAVENQLATDVRTCGCPEMQIAPDGTIWSCGCQVKRYGTIFRPEVPESYWEEPEHRCDLRETWRYADGDEDATEHEVERVGDQGSQL